MIRSTNSNVNQIPQKKSMMVKIVSVVGSLAGAAGPSADLESLENWGRVNAQEVLTDSRISVTEIIENI